MIRVFKTALCFSDDKITVDRQIKMGVRYTF